MGSPILPGKSLGRYQIRSKIGEGGMGEVYLAHDTQLNRSIALKILTAGVTNDSQRFHRFLQEAQSASALSHANVAHIYDIGKEGDSHFIAMEYVEGRQLDSHIHGQPLPTVELLELGIQIADALDEAHSKGIVHRDIKSSNVMITRRGQVKVLDFGLAKVSPFPFSGSSGDSELATRVRTSPGVVMGTVNYMSPEQALGREVDHRTDIFSLGVVLYEMATARAPFNATSVTETIDRIAHSQPDPIARFNYEFPVELEAIIKKAMRKDRDERYQTMHDLLIDLRNFKAEYEVSQRFKSEVTPISEVSRAHDGMAPERSTTAAISPPRPTSSAEYIVGGIKKHKLAIGAATLVLSAVVIGAGFLLLRTFKTPASSPTLPVINFNRLTAGGRIGNELISGGAAISPDGKYVVFWTQDQDKSSCYVRQISTNSLVRILGPTEMDAGGSTFSPDGEFVYFNSAGQTNPDGALFKIPVLGGTPEKVLDGIWSPVSFSPDGKQIAYVRLFPATGESWLVVANADGSGTPRIISKRKVPDYYSKDGPAWSPDGKRIAVGANTVPEILNAKIVEVAVDGGPEKTITQPQWSEIYRVLWIKDGSGLILAGTSSIVSFGSQIWYVLYPDGATRRVTNDLNGYGSVSLGLTADSQTIVTVQEDISRTIWQSAYSQGQTQARQISTGKYEGVFSLNYTPDDRIIYVDYSGTGNDIWTMKADGSDRRQVTSDGAFKFNASITRDDRYVVFNSNRAGSFDIWRVDVNGANQKQLTHNETFAISPTGSADSKWVVYQSLHDGKWFLWKVPIDGGDAIRIADKQYALPVISPDGKSIACLAAKENESFKWQIAIISSDDGSLVKLMDLPPTFNFSSGLKWSPDGSSILYVETKGATSNIYSQPLNGDAPKALTRFTSDFIAAFTWSRDGKQLFFGRGPTIDDVVLIKGFR
ncbi:MAG: hypothetical protein C5B44_00280 [Acidobacteria bacterium]|nr:MAG: hypothetical protein C5B44_00280 [Acidobacteriota bacterium]